ncbi:MULTISPECIES: hypothetical protein [unclassified Nocardia]|uniref:hypothetical protein n=1 Tax=unclassified Nocardia TaxID=2637762 RepID=UPI0024A8ADAF|nr:MULTISPECIES: hypothetical protein [unclassified Nocardia]
MLELWRQQGARTPEGGDPPQRGLVAVPDFESEPEAEAQEESPQARLSTYVNSATARCLRDLMDAEGVTLTEAVRRLIAYGDIVYQAHKAGRKVLLHAEGRTDQVIVAQ